MSSRRSVYKSKKKDNINFGLQSRDEDDESDEDAANDTNFGIDSIY